MKNELTLVAKQSALRASEESVRLWALASAEYPIRGGALIQNYSEMAVLNSVTEFAVNGRRAMEAYKLKENFYLKQPRWNWKPTKGHDKVGELREAFNRIVHAQRLDVGFEKLPTKSSCMGGEGIVIPYIMAQTDRKALSFIDLFAMAHAWLFQVMAHINQPLTEEAQQDGDAKRD